MVTTHALNASRTMQVEPEALAQLQLGLAVLTPLRSNGFQ